MVTKKLKVNPSIVPNFFTIANMFCGYFSVILSTQGKFSLAAWLIVAAAVLDILDGKLARLTKSSSIFGLQYDSLADVTSFGFAPSFLAYSVLFNKWGTIGLFLSFIPLVFGSIRLARFNIRQRSESKDYFEGLPIPASAVTIATFVVFNYYFWGYFRWSKIFLIIILFLSIMMISLIRYEKLPEFSIQSNTSNRIKVLFVVSCITIIIFFPHESFFPFAILYSLSGPGRALFFLLSPSGDNKNNETGKLDQ
jgi:CDP-diacylglycerol--serine O-phosphatidyltransferase